MTTKTQLVTFVLEGWDGDPELKEVDLVPVKFRGALEYAEDVLLTEEHVKAYAIDMVRRIKGDDFTDAFWDQPFEFGWDVKTLERGISESKS